MLNVIHGPREAVLFCVARFLPGDERHIREVVIPFESRAAAARHAIERGWPSEGFQVASLRFFVEEVPNKTYRVGRRASSVPVAAGE